MPGVPTRWIRPGSQLRCRLGLYALLCTDKTPHKVTKSMAYVEFVQTRRWCSHMAMTLVPGEVHSDYIVFWG